MSTVQPTTITATNGAGASGAKQLTPFQRKVTDFRGLLERLKPQMAMALPKHLKPERLARIVLTSVQKTPKLLDCTQESLLACIIQAAQLGLEPDGMLGHAYLVPYKTTCTLIPGYKGLIKLARQSGELASITARVVHAKDEFSYSFGLEETLVHIPATPPTDADDWDPGLAIFVYAVAKMKDGTRQFDVMHYHDVEAIRKRSKAANDGPWVTDWEEMAKKTVLRRLCKMLPASVELATAVAIDERADAGISQELENVVDVTAIETTATAGEVAAVPAEPATKLDALTKAVKAKPKGVQVELTPPIPLEDMTAKEREDWERQVASLQDVSDGVIK